MATWRCGNETPHLSIRRPAPTRLTVTTTINCLLPERSISPDWILILVAVYRVARLGTVLDMPCALRRLRRKLAFRLATFAKFNKRSRDRELGCSSIT